MSSERNLAILLLLAAPVFAHHSVRRLEARGVVKNAIKPGDHVIVEGYPSRDNLEHRLFMRGIIRSTDGWKSGKDI